MPKQDSALILKLRRAQKIAKILCSELDELLDAFQDPDVLQAELEGLAPEINDKFDRVLDTFLILGEKKRKRRK